MTIRVHESDGTFDHVVHLEENSTKFSLQYHTKYKKIRRRRWAPDQAGDDGDEDDGEDGDAKKSSESSRVVDTTS